MMSSLFKRPFFTSLLLFIFFVGLYIHNLSRSVYGGDVGDLVTAASLGGVAHPPGYPLFTSIGYLLTRFSFFGNSQAFQVGLISAVSAAGGVAVMYLLVLLYTKKRLVACMTSLILGLSFLYWFYAEIAEVFALNAFFALVLFYASSVFRMQKKWWQLLLLSFFAGLSLTNHQTILLLFPSLLLLVAQPAFSLFRKHIFLVGGVMCAFLLGFAPYLYVIIASSFHPLLNWDNVHNLRSFIHLLLRQDYGTFRAGSFEQPDIHQRLTSVVIYLQYLLVQLTIPVVFLSLLGMWVMLKKDKLLLISITLAYILSGPFFVGYAGFPMTSSFILGVYERFFLLSGVIVLFPFPFGLQYLTEKLASFFPRRPYVLLFQSMFLLIPLSLFLYNFPKTNLSSVMIGDTYVEDILSPLPKNAVLVITGDTEVFNTWYVHYVRNFRPDVMIYNIGGSIPTPEILARLKKYTGEKQTTALLHVLEDLNPTRPVFSTVILQPESGKKVLWVPFGLTNALVTDESAIPSHDLYLKKTDIIWKKIHLPTAADQQNKAFHNLTISGFSEVYSSALLSLGTFLYSQYHDEQSAFSFYSKAKDVAPDNPKVYETLAVYYSGNGGSCKEVETNLSIALSLNPYEKLPYFLLYNTYATCFKDAKAASNIAKEYQQIFESNFQKDLRLSLTDTLLPQ